MQNYLSETHNKIKLRVHRHHNFPPHFHKELEIIFMLEGSNTANCNGTTYTIPAGSVFFAPPNAIHSYQNPLNQCYSLLLIVDPHLLVGPAAQLASCIPLFPIWNDPEQKSIIWNMIQYVHEYGHSMSADNFILLLSSIISLLLENMPLANTTQSQRTEQRILNYCQEHYLEPITSDQVAAALGLSRSRVSHIFSNVFNTSFPTYINGLRLNDAIRLLVNTKLSVIEISAQAGFASLRTFNRVFTDHFGFSPSQCRKYHRESELQSPNFIGGEQKTQS